MNKKDAFLTVPLKLEGVIVGKVCIGENNELEVDIHRKDTQSFLKELLLSSMAESLSFNIDYPVAYQPIALKKGHLSLVQEY